MLATTRFVAAALFVVPVFASDPAGFALWKAVELKQRDEALSKKVGQDHSARETLHDNVVDVVIVRSGEGTLVLGGKMINPKASAGAGESTGTSIEGGARHPLGAGDVAHIPAKIPHSFLVPRGKHITYVLVKFPAQ